jgi:MFS family permease
LSSPIPRAPAEPAVSAAAEADFTARKLITATACLLGATFVPYVQATIAPLMMLPMIGEFGWTRTEFSFAATFLFFFGSVSVLFFGRVADRVGARTILLVGAVGGGAIMLLLSLQDRELWRLYGAYALLGTFGSSGVGYTKIIGTLFTRHRGKALALFGAESTIALAVLPMLTNTLLNHVGWRGAYLVYGTIMLLMTPVIYFLIREPGAGGKGARPPPMAGLTPAQFRRDRAFWLIVLVAVLGVSLATALNAHIIAAITDKGFTATVAAGALSAATLVGLAGTLAGGFALDHFPTARVLSAFGVLSACGWLLFSFADSAFGGFPLLIIAMSMQGAAVAALRMGGPYLQTRFVGLRSFAEANGVQIFFQGVALGIGPPLFGMIYERTGSYAPVYWIVSGGAITAAVVLFLLGPYRYRVDVGGERR